MVLLGIYFLRSRNLDEMIPTAPRERHSSIDLSQAMKSTFTLSERRSFMSFFEKFALRCGDIEASRKHVRSVLCGAASRFHFPGSGHAVESYVRKAIRKDFQARHRRDAQTEGRLEPDVDRLIASEDGVSVDPTRELDQSKAVERLAALPHRLRVAVRLRFLEEMDDEEAAPAMGISIDEYREAVTAGLEALRESFRR